MKHIPTLDATPIEHPVQRFHVQYTHAAYQPDGRPVSFPVEVRIERVLAETKSGAIAIAKYHPFSLRIRL